jgi:hypothetical protein
LLGQGRLILKTNSTSAFYKNAYAGYEYKQINSQ